MAKVQPNPKTGAVIVILTKGEGVRLSDICADALAEWYDEIDPLTRKVLTDLTNGLPND